MLDKLIGDIKEKFQKKPEEDSGDKTNPNASSLKELLNDEKESAPSDSTEEIKIPSTDKKILGFKIPTDPKEKKSFFIRIFIVVLIGYFLVDEFVLKDASTNSIEETVAVAPPRKRKKRKPKVEEPPAQVEASAPAVVNETAEGSTPIETIPNVITDTSKVTETPAPDPEKFNVEEVVNPQSAVPTPEPVLEDKPSESAPAVTENYGELNLGTGQKIEDIAKEDRPAPEVKIEDKLNKIITQVDENATSEVKEYVAPPDYESMGRGLVYNCQNKHWACIDRDNYFKCEKNSRWLIAHKKSPECAVQNVYATDVDCQTTQKYNVQEIVKPKGCKP